MEEYAGTNDLVAEYKEQLQNGKIQEAYRRLLQFMRVLNVGFEERNTGAYKAGNISPGYLDYSYFPIFNEILRERMLRFGIVLNHGQMQFELWLMGRNAAVQEAYWEKLKDTKWNRHRTEMPRYSVLEIVLEQAPDFANEEGLAERILNAAATAIKAVEEKLVELEMKGL